MTPRKCANGLLVDQVLYSKVKMFFFLTVLTCKYLLEPKILYIKISKIIKIMLTNGKPND